jgi:hypothetical protein
MKKNILCLLLLILGSTVFAEKAAVLPEISYPYSITAAENRLYITEETAVYIYSLEDFSLIRSFGKAGRGVGEFKGRIMLTIQPGCLFINSRGKTSCFSIEGDFIKEEKKPGYTPTWMSYIPWGNGFIAREFKREHQGNFFTRFFSILFSETGVPTSGFYFNINRCDSNKRKVKTIFTYKHPFYSGKSINPADIRGACYRIYGDKLFMDDKDGVIHVFDTEGEELYSIRYPFEKIEITGRHKRRYLRSWMEKMPVDYGQLESRLRFPRYFPPVRNFFVSDERLYVLTFKEAEGKSELLILTLKGELLRKVWVPLVKIDSLVPFQISRYTINSGRLYRLVKNKERQYELHIMELNNDV